MKILGWLMLLVTLWGCRGDEINVQCGCLAQPNPLGKWRFIGYRNANNAKLNATTPYHSYDAYVEFLVDSEGKNLIQGQMAINFLTGSFEYQLRPNDPNGHRLTIPVLGATKIGVTSPQAEFEQMFFEQFKKTSAFDMTGKGALLLYDQKVNPTEIMIFRKKL